MTPLLSACWRFMVTGSTDLGFANLGYLDVRTPEMRQALARALRRQRLELKSAPGPVRVIGDRVVDAREAKLARLQSAANVTRFTRKAR